ncbi:MAG: XamI family restriction endonuclease, partial [Chloroflexota bacterium]
MPVNANKPDRWKSDIAQSVDFYNDWFMNFAPRAYRDTRVETTEQVISALEKTANLTNITANVLELQPSVLPILRMATAPPIARDRLIGLAGVSPN